jgi:hypothetical protein
MKVVVVVLMALGLGCNNANCVEGQSSACACPGTFGAQVCTKGVFGPCECDPKAMPRGDESLDRIRTEADEAAKRAVETVTNATSTIERLKSDLVEVRKMLRDAEDALSEAKTDADRAGARARLDVLKQKKKQLDELITKTRADADRLATGYGEAERVVAKMEEFTKRMCQCSDKACADRVNEDMTRWGTDMAKNAKWNRDEKPDPDMAKKSAEIMTRYTECMTKMMMLPRTGDGM